MATLHASQPLTFDLKLIDIDVDGDPDLLLLPPSYNEPVDFARVRVVENLGGGTFGSVVALPILTAGSPLGHVADLDSDGADDFLVARFSFGQIYAFAGGAARIIGESMCGPGALNSVGLDGRLRARGSLVTGQNSARITADRLPPGSFGSFLCSQTLVASTPVAGSAGRICLGGSIGRFVGAGQIQQSSASGRFALDLDLFALPSPAGAVAAMAGETWAFQAWHRDVAQSVATSNFTDSVALTWQ